MSKEDGVLSHRCFVFEGINAPVSTFYRLVEEIIAFRRIPKAKVSRILLAEGKVFGAKREYLRVQRGSEVFDICAASFGASFMVTYWLRRVPRFRWKRWGFGLFAAFFFLNLLSNLAAGNPGRALAPCIALPVSLILLALPLFFALKFITAHWFVTVLRAVVGVGWKAARTPTIYEADSVSAFHASVPSVVEQAVQILRGGQSLRSPRGEALPLPPASSA